MKLTTTLFLFATVPALAASPSADEVLARSRKALGNVAGIKSLVIDGVRRTSIDGPDGQRTLSRESELSFLLPDKFLRAETMDLPGGMPGPTLVDGLDGETSWNDTRNSPTGANMVVVRRAPPPDGAASSDPAAMEKARTRSLRTAFLRNVLLYTLTPPEGVDIKFELVGEAESPDGKAWMVDAKGPENFALRLFIDQKTNLPVMASWRGYQAVRPVMRSIQMSGDGHTPPDPKKLEAEARASMPKPKEVEFELRLGEYEKQGGVLFPKISTMHSEDKLIEEFEIKSVKVNPSNLKPEKFRK
jgi:hypothetical protein